MTETAHITDRPTAGRTVLITGANAGIGKAAALRIAHMRARVALTGSDPAE